MSSFFYLIPSRRLRWYTRPMVPTEQNLYCLHGARAQKKAVPVDINRRSLRRRRDRRRFPAAPPSSPSSANGLGLPSRDLSPSPRPARWGQSWLADCMRPLLDASPADLCHSSCRGRARDPAPSLHLVAPVHPSFRAHFCGVVSDSFLMSAYKRFDGDE